jgi:hypothetical protein
MPNVFVGVLTAMKMISASAMEFAQAVVKERFAGSYRRT